MRERERQQNEWKKWRKIDREETKECMRCLHSVYAHIITWNFTLNRHTLGITDVIGVVALLLCVAYA